MPNTCSMGATLENETFLQFKCWWASYSTYWRPTVQQFLGIFGLYRSNYKVAPSLPSFYSHFFKTIQTAAFLRARPPGAAHPHPDLFPSSETLASVPPLNPDIKQHPAKHNMTLTVETCTMRKGRFSPQTKQQKQAGSRPQNNKQRLFSMVFRCFGCKSALLSPLGCKRWIGESMENRFSWSLFVSDVKKFDGFQITSVVNKKNYCVWCLFSIWSLYIVFIYVMFIYLMCNY